MQEAIYSLLMMQNSFIAPSINIENLDENAGNIPVARQRIDDIDLQTVLSNSFGFGGTNCTLAFSKFKD